MFSVYSVVKNLPNSFCVLLAFRGLKSSLLIIFEIPIPSIKLANLLIFINSLSDLLKRLAGFREQEKTSDLMALS